MVRQSVTYEMIENAASKSSSMRQAAELSGIPYGTFIRYAKKFGLYNPNQGLKGSSKAWKIERKKNLTDYLKSNVGVNSSRFKKMLIEAGMLKEECESCGIGPVWNNRKLVLQLDHKDGNNRNNVLSNLRIMCPNCHSQTETFCRGHGKNYAEVAKLVAALSLEVSG